MSPAPPQRPTRAAQGAPPPTAERPLIDGAHAIFTHAIFTHAIFTHSGPPALRRRHEEPPDAA